MQSLASYVVSYAISMKYVIHHILWFFIKNSCCAEIGLLTCVLWRYIVYAQRPSPSQAAHSVINPTNSSKI